MIKLFPLRGKQAMAALLVGLTLAIGGCDAPPQEGVPNAPKTSEQTPGVPTESEKPQPKEMTVNLYYPNDDGSKLITVRRKLELNEKRDKYVAAIEAIMQDFGGQVTVFPHKTRLNSVTVENGTAKVDFSAELKKNFVGGSTGEEMLIGSVVNTLTEFDEVKNVEFYIDGKKIDTISGHSDLSEPVGRMAGLIK